MLEENVCFFIFILLHHHHTCHERPSKGGGLPTATTSSSGSTSARWKIISSKDSVLKISHCDAKEAFFVWSPLPLPPTLEMTGSVKCTTAQLHISFDCQFVLCAARGFELRLKMKANLVLSVSTVGRRCLFCCRQHQELGDFFFFFFPWSFLWIEHYV